MCCIKRRLWVSLLTPARKLPGTWGSSARRLPLLSKAALHCSHGGATAAAGHRAPAPTGLPPIPRKARPDVLSHGAVPRNDVGPGGPAPAHGQGAGSAQQMFPLPPASPGCL